METTGNAIALTGLGVCGLAQLWVVLAAFKQGIAWGLLVLFIPGVALIFLVVHFGTMKFPLGLFVVGLLVVFLGAAMVTKGNRHRRELAAQQDSP